MPKVKNAAMFIKANIIPQTDGNPDVAAFRSFLHTFFDIVIADASNTEDEELTFMLPLYMLYAMGLCADISEQGGLHLVLDGASLDALFKSFRGKNAQTHMVALSDAGIRFEGIDVTEKRFRLSSAGTFEAWYPDNQQMLAGLCVMAKTAQRFGKSPNDKGTIHRIFVRCNERMLALPKKNHIALSECVGSLPETIAQYLIALDAQLMEKCKCEEKHGLGESRFIYTSKKTKLTMFTINVGMDGYWIKLNPKHMELADLEHMPKNIAEALKNGFDCAKNAGEDKCNPKCHTNLIFELDGKSYMKCKSLNFQLPVSETEDRDFTQKWLERELALA